MISSPFVVNLSSTSLLSNSSRWVNSWKFILKCLLFSLRSIFTTASEDWRYESKSSYGALQQTIYRELCSDMDQLKCCALIRISYWRGLQWLQAHTVKSNHREPQRSRSLPELPPVCISISNKEIWKEWCRMDLIRCLLIIDENSSGSLLHLAGAPGPSISVLWLLRPLSFQQHQKGLLLISSLAILWHGEAMSSTSDRSAILFSVHVSSSPDIL